MADGEFDEVLMLDGMDAAYRDYLHRAFSELEDAYGDELWWTSMDEMAARCLDLAQHGDAGSAYADASGELKQHPPKEWQ